jgi:hypothetical protein
MKANIAPSLEMAGASIMLVRLDDQTEQLPAAGAEAEILLRIFSRIAAGRPPSEITELRRRHRATHSNCDISQSAAEDGSVSLPAAIRDDSNKSSRRSR